MSETFPRSFGRYQLLGLLGSGGMAQVFRAETVPIAGIRRTLAIKRITAGGDPLMDASLVEEARIWVRLQHPNIVSVVDFGEQDGDWFLALELVEGISAAQLLAFGEPLPITEAICIVERVAKALAHAHSLTDAGRPLGIVHRDVKPANILVSTRGEVKLTDFGIARAVDTSTRTMGGMVKGSVPYLSPEQARGEPLDARTDLFSLGCTLHQLLTGRRLIDAPGDAALAILARGEIPPPPPGLPPAVRELLGALTSPDKRRRPASAADVARQARAMLLPESVDDVESVLGARVRRIASAHGLGAPEVRAAPESDPTDTAPAAVSASAAETADVAPVAAPQSTPRSEPRRDAPSPILVFLQSPVVTYGVALVLLIALGLGGGRWFLCKRATAAREDARGGFLSLARASEAEVSRCRFCGATEADRASRALAIFRAGSPLADAVRGLGESPVERRALATLELADAGWSAAAVTSTRRDLQTPAGACLSAIAAFDRGAHALPVFPVDAAGEPCGLVLRGSSRLANGDLAGAEEIYSRLASHRAGPAGRMMVASMRIAPLDLEAALIASERLRDRPDEELGGIWIPSSWFPLPGEPGRVTSALDDLPTLAALARGDLLARERKVDAARLEYEKPRTRGWRTAEIAARIADAEVARGNPDAAALALLSARKDSPASPLLLAREVRVMIARRHWSDAEAALAAVKNPETLAALRAELARERARPADSRPYGAGDVAAMNEPRTRPFRPGETTPAAATPGPTFRPGAVVADPNAPKLRRSIDVGKTLAEAKKRVEAGRAGQAISLLENAVHSEPNETVLVFELWKLHSRHGEVSSARRWAARYLELDSKSSRADTVRAWQAKAK